MLLNNLNYHFNDNNKYSFSHNILLCISIVIFIIIFVYLFLKKNNNIKFIKNVNLLNRIEHFLSKYTNDNTKNNIQNNNIEEIDDHIFIIKSDETNDNNEIKNRQSKYNNNSNNDSNKNSNNNSKQTPKKNIDYKNESILLSCFNKKDLDTFNKYEKYATRIYYKEDDEVVGEVWITPSKHMENVPQISLDGYYLNNLCVKKEYRRKGIARKLLERVAERARDEGKLHIILQVDMKKTYLTDFYSSLDFKVYMSGFNKKGEHKALMFLPL